MRIRLLLLLLGLTALLLGLSGCGSRRYGASPYGRGGYDRAGGICDPYHYRKHRAFRRGCAACRHYQRFHARGRRGRRW